MSTALLQLQKISRQIKTIQKTGLEVELPPKASENEAVAQGDFMVRNIRNVPKEYVKALKPSKQLVPGKLTMGSSHILDSLDGVTIYLPPNWGDNNVLDGPVLVLTETRRILHPVHRTIVINPTDGAIDCWYQRSPTNERQID